MSQGFKEADKVFCYDFEVRIPHQTLFAPHPCCWPGLGSAKRHRGHFKERPGWAKQSRRPNNQPVISLRFIYQSRFSVGVRGGGVYGSLRWGGLQGGGVSLHAEDTAHFIYLRDKFLFIFSICHQVCVLW